MIHSDDWSTTERRGWWEELARFAGFPEPKELIAFAALNCPKDIWLQDEITLDRVAEAYIAHCRKVGFWDYFSSRVPFHEAGLGGYRDRLKDYKAGLKYFQRRSC